MNNQKKIELNSFSLMGLKAELLKKKQEVVAAKALAQVQKKKPPAPKAKLKTKLEKLNEELPEEKRKTAEEVQQESDLLKRSRNVLEAKARLYEKLTSSGGESKLDTSNFLVDFKQKSTEDIVIIPQPKEEEKTFEVLVNKLIEKDKKEPVESDDDDYDSDDDWVEFTDCLGRTKKCLKEDLKEMQLRDNMLKVSLFGDSAEKNPDDLRKPLSSMPTISEVVNAPELCSDDMRREMMREKWEEKEKELIDKKDVHYQDVLFDEVRNHGTGYYQFSTMLDERLRQQEEFKKMRQQAKAAQAEFKRKKAELREERRNEREKAGLPPEDESEEEKSEEEKEVEELLPEVLRPALPRAWDIDKVGTRKETKIMTQEEWVDKRRQERPSEFAPPTSFDSSREEEFRYVRKKKRKFETETETEEAADMPEGYLEDIKKSRKSPEVVKTYEPIKDEIQDKKEEDEEGEEKEEDDGEKFSEAKPKTETTRRGAGVEIPPPPIFELYGPSTSYKKPARPSGVNASAIAASVEEGLKFLRKKAEEKQKRKRQDWDLNIM